MVVGKNIAIIVFQAIKHILSHYNTAVILIILDDVLPRALQCSIHTQNLRILLLLNSRILFYCFVLPHFYHSDNEIV